jgi:flavin reductase (DIM6/NTAB) family NADH-FMN oxidoreductase RutF
MEMTSIDEYRNAAACLATSVSIVTSATRNERAGTTVSAICSVSLDPILLLVCLHCKARTHDLILQSERFGVSVLGERAESVALRFARPNPDKFKNVATRESHGVPILSDALATFICALHQKVDAGDHSIFIGRVLSCGSRAGTPQVHFNRQFCVLEDTSRRLVNDLYALGF